MIFRSATVIQIGSHIGCVILAVVVASAVAANRDVATLETNNGGTTLVVESGRPVAKAVELMIEKYGSVITYEDPRYTYQGDLVDVTAEVQKANSADDKNVQSSKVIVPKSDKLTVSFSTVDVATILKQILGAQAASGHGGRFRVQRNGNVFHIIPTEVRDENGNWATRSPILDTPISLPAEDRTDYELIEAICGAISATTATKIMPDTFGLRTGIRAAGGGRPKYRLGATNEPARDVLLRALAAIAPNRGRLTWLLLYSNEEAHQMYVLNMVSVPERSALTSSPPTPAAPAASSQTSLQGSSSANSQSTTSVPAKPHL